MLKGPRPGGVPGLLPGRTLVLNNAGTIIGVRLYGGGAGKGQLLNLGYTGQAGARDMPGVALQCSATSNTTGQSRRWLLRGIPDDQIIRGEWTPESVHIQAMQGYFASLAGFGWLAQTNSGQVNVFSVSANGSVTTTAPVGFAVGSIVTFKNVTISSTGLRIGYKGVVTAIGPLNTNFTVGAWPYASGGGGTVGVTGSGFQDFAGATKSVVRATYRKVGRPFAGYRGRASRRPVTV
jgi:hypothetical protein